MSAVADLMLRITANPRSAVQGLDKVRGELDKTGKSAVTIGDRFGAIGAGAKKMALGLGIAAAGLAAAKIGQFISGSADAAKNLGESMNAVNKVFGDASGTVLEFGKVSAQAVGLSSRAFNELATNTGAMLTNMGIGQKEAAAETIRLTQRAADMASVFNTDVSQAMDAVNSALRGETEPIRKFGVSINAAAVEQKALALGLIEAGQEMDANAKATATLKLIYEQTSKVQGDFIQTSDEVANAQRRNQAAAENASAAFGKAFLPVKAWGLENATILMLGLRQAMGDTSATAELRMNEAMKTLVDTMGSGGDVAVAFANGLAHITKNGDLTVGQIEALAAATGLDAERTGEAIRMNLEWAKTNGGTKEEVEALEDALLNQVDAMGLSGDAASDLIDELGLTEAQARRTGGEVDTLAGRSKTLAERLLEAQSGAKGLADALSRTLSPVGQAKDAMDRLSEAQKKVDELNAQGKQGTEEWAESMLGLAEAKAAAQAAIDSLSAQGITLTADSMAKALNLPKDQAVKLLETLGLISNGKWTTVVEIREKLYTAAEGGTADRRSFGSLGRRAQGGPVSAGTPYLVGERGPELMVPASSGTVISTADLAAMLSGLGGPSFNLAAGAVQISNPVPEPASASVPKALRRLAMSLS